MCVRRVRVSANLELDEDGYDEGSSLPGTSRSTRQNLATLEKEEPHLQYTTEHSHNFNTSSVRLTYVHIIAY